MQRLLADAQKLTGVKYDISNFADITEAIHVVQTEMGITGTTAKEASETFTGSLASMKAAASNLLTAIGSGEDIAEPLQNLADSAKTFLLGNALPMLKDILMQVPEMLPGFMSGLGDVLKELSPELLTATTDLLTQLIEMLPGFISGLSDTLGALAPQLVSAVFDLFGTLFNELPALGSSLIELGGRLISGILTGIKEKLSSPDDIADTIKNFVGNMKDFWLDSALPMAMDILAQLTDVLPDIIETLCETLIELSPELMAAGFELLWGIIKRAPEFLLRVVELGGNIIAGLLKGITGGLGKLWEKAKEIATGFLDRIKKGLGIASPSKEMAWIGKMADEGLAQGLIKNSGLIDSALSKITNPMRNEREYRLQGFTIPVFADGAVAQLGDIRDALSLTGTAAKTVGGAFAGITGNLGKFAEKAKETAAGILNRASAEITIKTQTPDEAWVEKLTDTEITQHLRLNAHVIDDAAANLKAPRVAEIAPMQISEIKTDATDNTDVIKAIERLRDKLGDLSVFLDGDTLVGGISGRVDTTLGRQTVSAGRLALVR